MVAAVGLSAAGPAAGRVVAAKGSRPAHRPRAEIGRNPLGIPLSPQFDNFREAWTRGDYATSFQNSAFISLGSAANVADMIELLGIVAGELARIVDDTHVL